MITAREMIHEKTAKEYNLEFTSIDIDELKKEFNKICKKYKKYDNIDKITLKIDIKYHENGNYLFYKGL